MAGKISEYPSSITTLASGDLFDVSEFLNPGYESKKLDWSTLLTELNSQITFANIYTTDGTTTGQRTISIGTNDLIFGSTGDTNLLRFDATADRIGIGTATPTEKLEVAGNALIQQGSFTYGGTTIESRVANNRGNILAFTNAGGVSFNDYGNLAGAAQGLQDFKSHFANYRLASTKNSSGYTDQTFLHLDTNQSNSAPSVKAGINTINSSTYTVLDVGINKNGPVNTNAEPIAVNVADNFGVWNEDFAGVDKVKTGFKSSMTDTFTSSTTGSGIVRSFWANAQGGDVNQALFADNGDVIVNNGSLGMGTSTPTEKLEVVGNTYTTGQGSFGAVINANQQLAAVGNGKFIGIQGTNSNITTNNGAAIRGTASSTAAVEVYGVDGSATGSDANGNSTGVRGNAITSGTRNHVGGKFVGNNGTNQNIGVRGTTGNGTTGTIIRGVLGESLYQGASDAYAGYFSAQGAKVGQNIGLYATATGAATNYAAIFDAGNVGIGTATPASKLEVNGNTDSTTYSVNGTAGANFSGAVTNITVVNGIVTAVS